MQLTSFKSLPSLKLITNEQSLSADPGRNIVILRTVKTSSAFSSNLAGGMLCSPGPVNSFKNRRMGNNKQISLCLLDIPSYSTYFDPNKPSTANKMTKLQTWSVQNDVHMKNLNANKKGLN